MFLTALASLMLRSSWSLTRGVFYPILFKCRKIGHCLAGIDASEARLIYPILEYRTEIVKSHQRDKFPFLYAVSLFEHASEWPQKRTLCVPVALDPKSLYRSIK